jgi:hypothetical protein
MMLQKLIVMVIILTRLLIQMALHFGIQENGLVEQHQILKEHVFIHSYLPLLQMQMFQSHHLMLTILFALEIQ